MSHRPLALLTGAMALTALVVPAAEAAVVAYQPACVVNDPTQPANWQVSASGFTPGSFVSFNADDQPVASGPADAAGNVVPAPVGAPAISGDDFEQTFQLTASGAGIAAGPVAVPVVRKGVKIPRRARPRSRVSYKVYGFAPGAPVYLHIRRNGRTLGNFNLGRTEGACGTTSKRLRYMPLRRFRYVTYEYYFSQSRRYDRATVYPAFYRVTITRTLRPRTAAAALAG